VTSHLGLLVLFSSLVSIVFAVMLRDEPSAQLSFGLRAFLGFVGAAIAAGWLLYPLPL
jgi:hypothetical protein